MSDQKSITTSAPKTVTTVTRVRSLIEAPEIRKRFDEVLGAKSAGFVSSVISCVSGNKALQDCDPMTIVGAAAVAAACDLPINPSLGFAYIVPYSGKAQFQIGWKGFVQLGMRSGQYKTMNATVVYDGQLVDYNQFTGEMTFQPDAKSDNPIGYLFYFKLLNGYEKYTYMTREECEAHGKRYSRSYNSTHSKWKSDFDAMALKTVVIRGLSRWGILSIEMQNAVVFDGGVMDSSQLDEAQVQYPDREPDESDKLPPAPKKSRLSKAVEASQPREVQESAHTETNDEAPI